MKGVVVVLGRKKEKRSVPAAETALRGVVDAQRALRSPPKFHATAEADPPEILPPFTM